MEEMQEFCCASKERQVLGVYLEQVCDHDGAVPLEPDDGDRAVEAPRHHALPPHRYHGDGPRVCAHHGAALHHTAAVLNSAVKQSIGFTIGFHNQVYLPSGQCQFSIVS